MKKAFCQNFSLVLILILSFFLRIYRFDKVPPGVDWDEMAVGYNAYSILKTARDEHGEFLPLTFKSFGDYKAPLFIYLLVPFIKFFGRTTFALRLPSALFGTLTVFLTYFLTKEIFKKSHYSLLVTHYLPITASSLLAISPWHLQFSRVAFEPNIALFFVVFGVLLFLKGIRIDSSFFLIAGSALLALSLLTYHSSKIFTPLLFLLLILLYKERLLKKKKSLVIVFFTFFLFALPVFLTIFTAGSSRLQAAGIFGQFSTIEEIGRLRKENEDKPFWLVRILYNRPVFLTKKIIRGYFSHFTPSFLFLGKETNWRVSLPFQGQLYLCEAPFFLFGIYHLLLSLREKTSKFILSWWLLAPIPASIGQLTPHALRTLAALPMPQLITALGLVSFFELVKKYRMRERLFSNREYLGRKSRDEAEENELAEGASLRMLRILIRSSSFIYTLLLVAFLFFIGSYFHNYHVKFPYESGFDWQEGHKEMVEFVRNYEGKVKKIIVTDYYMQPYIFFLWFGKIEPEVYQAKGLPGYEFRRINWGEDRKNENVILVGTEEEIPAHEEVIKEIKFSNGKTAFKIVKT